MKITLVLCTYNRCESLGRVLNCAAALNVSPSTSLEILVVDNNSADQTRDVVEAYSRLYPGLFRYLFEPEQGLSHARNAGIRAAQGDIIAFTDDDVIFEPDWLNNLTLPLQEGKWSGVGGRVLPQWECTAPDWLAVAGPYALAPVLAIFDQGLESKPLEHAPFGANMAFQKEMFLKYGAFRTDLGRCGADSLMCNEDTEFGRRLMAGRERLVYQPSAIIHHPVPRYRLNKQYFLAWWFAHGRSIVREWRSNQDVWHIPGLYLSVVRVGATIALRQALCWMLTLKPPKRFYHKAMVWWAAGQIAEFFALAGSNGKQGPARASRLPS